MCVSVKSQDLIIDAGASITLAGGSSLNIKGLELQPSVEFVLGENNITKTSIPVNIDGFESIARVYMNSPTITNFVGTFILHYDDEDLVGPPIIPEEKLLLEVKDENGDWVYYNAAKDATLKTLTYDFSAGINFQSVTAVSDDIVLSVKEHEIMGVSVYPNPVETELFISSDKNLSFEVFSMLGKSVLRTTKKRINVDHLAYGMYLLRITDIETQNSNWYKILKK